MSSTLRIKPQKCTSCALQIFTQMCDVDDISTEYKKEAVEYWKSGKSKAKNNRICEIKVSESFISKTIATMEATTEYK